MNRERNRRWRENHPELKAKNRAYYLATRDHAVAQRRLHYEANRQSYIERARAWGIGNPEAKARALQRWRVAHPELVRVQWKRQNAARRGADGAFSTAEWNALVDSYGGRCAYCNKAAARLEADHRVPLSAGGAGDISNILPACRSCNARKGARAEEAFRMVMTNDGHINRLGSRP